MKTYQDYKLIADKIDLIASDLGKNFLSDDICVNIENLPENELQCFDSDNSHQDWTLMIHIAEQTFGMRCENLGLNANDYGIKY